MKTIITAAAIALMSTASNAAVLATQTFIQNEPQGNFEVIDLPGLSCYQASTAVSRYLSSELGTDTTVVDMGVDGPTGFKRYVVLVDGVPLSLGTFVGILCQE